MFHCVFRTPCLPVHSPALFSKPQSINLLLYRRVLCCTVSLVCRVYVSPQLVSWCFEPSQPHRITSGLNTDFTLSPSHSFHKSSWHKSCFWSLSIFRGRSTREPASSRVTYFIPRAYTGSMCQPQPTQVKRKRENNLAKK